MVVDFETIELLPDGSKRASTEFYRSNFRVDSCAFTYRDEKTREIVSRFVEGEDAVKKELAALHPDTQLVAHNLFFELGVTRCRFPDLNLTWYADTMRMVQVWDTGGDDRHCEVIFPVLDNPDGHREEPETKKVPTFGFGLVKAAKRVLGAEDHKLEAYTWLRNAGVKKGQEGAHLHLLPRDIYERYNVGDTETTLKLYEFLEERFLELDYNWRFDHELFLSTLGYMVNAKIRGVRVDRPKLQAYVDQVREEIARISADFAIKFANEIKQVERARLIKRLSKYKTLKGKKKYLKTRPQKDWSKQVTFNPGSNNQLKMLFVDVLQIEPKFFTAKGAPSFKSALLGQWGEGGTMLAARRKRGIVLAQAESLLQLSAYDGRFHIDLKAVGTSTGRAAGGQNG